MTLTQKKTLMITIMVAFAGIAAGFAVDALAGSVPAPKQPSVTLEEHHYPNDLDRNAAWPESTLEQLPDRVDTLMNKPLNVSCKVRANMTFEGAMMRVAQIKIADYMINLNSWMKKEATENLQKWRSLNANEASFLGEHWNGGYEAMSAWIERQKDGNKARQKPTANVYKLRGQQLAAQFYGACMAGRLDRRF